MNEQRLKRFRALERESRLFLAEQDERIRRFAERREFIECARVENWQNGYDEAFVTFRTALENDFDEIDEALNEVADVARRNIQALKTYANARSWESAARVFDETSGVRAFLLRAGVMFDKKLAALQLDDKLEHMTSDMS